MTPTPTTLPEDAFAIVAGNGPSLGTIAPNRVLATDVMIRVNSFFLETAYHLGRRVDVALIAGDPRVVPFVVDTLHRAQAHYDLHRWTASTPKVAGIVRGVLERPEEQMRQTPEGEAELRRLSAHYQAEPTSGVMALFLAQAMGARQIGVTGIDLYSGPKRYAFEPGPRMRALLGRDLGTRSYDRRLHHPDIDKAAIDWLAAQDGMQLFRLSEDTPLAAHLDLAPTRIGAAPEAPPKPAIKDWSGWAGGWYPVQALWVMRKVRAAQRRVFGRK